jgi:hypothetical protein
MAPFKISSRKRFMRVEFRGFLLYLKKRSIIGRKSKVYAVDFVGRNITPVADGTITRSKMIETTRKSA